MVLGKVMLNPGLSLVQVLAMKRPLHSPFFGHARCFAHLITNRLSNCMPHLPPCLMYIIFCMFDAGLPQSLPPLHHA